MVGFRAAGMRTRAKEPSRSRAPSKGTTKRGADKQRLALRVAYRPSDAEPTVRGVRLGLQDKDQNVRSGKKAGEGRFVFEVEVEVSLSLASPGFSGPFTHGTPSERFLYLSWKRPPGADAPWVQRIKIPLRGISTATVTAALDAGRAVCCDVTGRKPHDTRPVVWH
jgi:Family of unknown function (DUF5990)